MVLSITLRITVKRLHSVKHKRYTEFHDLVTMLNVILIIVVTQSVNMLSVVMPSVVLLSVVAPLENVVFNFFLSRQHLFLARLKHARTRNTLHFRNNIIFYPTCRRKHKNIIFCSVLFKTQIIMIRLRRVNKNDNLDMFFWLLHLKMCQRFFQ